MDEKNLVSKEHLKSELESFRRFAFSDNLVAVAISLTMAAATQRMVSTISESLIMPFVNYMMASADGNWRSLVFVPVEGLNIEIGKMMGVTLEFCFTSLLAYILYEKLIKRLSSGRNDGEDRVGEKKPDSAQG